MLVLTSTEKQNKNYYEGEVNVETNHRHGYGITQMSNGDIYRGEYRNDKRNGYGTYIYDTSMNEEYYEGHFVNNKRDGYGIYTYRDKSVYSGWWKENLKEGAGVMTYADGIVIRGTFYEGTIKYGEILFPNGAKYIGEIESSLMHGHGTMYYADGLKIFGKFVNDMLVINEENDDIGCCFCLANDGCDKNCEEYERGICYGM